MFRWLIYSPRRAVKAALIAVFALALAFAMGVSSLLSRVPNASSAAQEPTAEPTVSATQSTASEPARVAAEKFTVAWLSADRDTKAWANRMRPYATEKLLKLTVLTDPANIPSAKVRISRVVTSTPTISGIAVELTNGTPVAVTVVNSGGTWLADDLRPLGT